MNLADTRRLFLQLLPQLQVDCVCDVGSMNGAESLAFRSVLPHAKIFAFEANPRNLGPMQNDEILRAAGIQIVPMAVTNFDGKSSFFVVDSPPGKPTDKQGMSSLYERPDSSLVQTSIQVAATRLDTFLSANHVSGGNIAVWMDVEGKAFEALQGASGLVPSICLLHVEVETRPCITANQKLEQDVRELLVKNGFCELARDSAEYSPQLNLVFIKADLPRKTISAAVRSARIAEARFRLRRFLRRLRARVRRRR